MISEILIIVSFVLILLGLIGVRTRNVKRKLLFLFVTTLGMLLLPFSQRNPLGILGGVWQTVFQIPELFCFILLILSLCRQNGIQRIEELAGVRQRAPYVYASGVVFAIAALGVPGTGTFIGYLYSALGLMTGGFNIFGYVGLAGIVLGTAVSAAIIFSILKSAYLPGGQKQKLSTKAGMIFVFLAFLVILCCVFQNQVVAWIVTPLGKIFS